MSNYSLEFLKKAEREWNSLGATIKVQLAKKLAERLRAPKVAKDKLAGYADLYKIKLRKAGYRLIYRVDDDRIIVLVVKIGQRARDKAYEGLNERLAEEE